MDKSEKVKLFGLIAILAGLAFLAGLPAEIAQADGPGGFPTNTPTFFIVPTFTSTPTNVIVPTVTSPYPYPLPLNNTLNLNIPEAQAEVAAEPEGRGFPTLLCIPIAIVAIILAIVGMNRIRKNYQGA
jgi:hypothetical protein